MPLISVIIPLAPGEQEWAQALEHFPKSLPSFEILVCHDGRDRGLEDKISDARAQARSVVTSGGRAGSMNQAAKEANGKWLFFLHADSRLEEPVFDRLQKLAGEEATALHYHDLKFAGDGPIAMRLNEWGVWFRSHALKMPFGDQGFFMPRSVFEQTGGYDEDAAFGEDHLLVWRARQLRIPIRCTGTVIRTSARKYAADGWLATTLRHLWLTVWQAAPELLKLIRLRFG